MGYLVVYIFSLGNTQQIALGFMVPEVINYPYSDLLIFST